MDFLINKNIELFIINCASALAQFNYIYIFP